MQFPNAVFHSITLPFQFVMESIDPTFKDRRLQMDDSPLNNDFFGAEPYIGTAADFLEPCYALPDNDEESIAAGWTKLLDEQDDGFFMIPDLGFSFDLYGHTYRYNQTFVNVNGFLSFSSDEGSDIPFFPLAFPNDVIDMVAPFWADIDIRTLRNGDPAGEIWYQQFGDHLAVVYNQVGYAAARIPTYKRNTFQVVISDGTSDRLGKSKNVCFCYVDMEWWTSQFNFMESPATVGINSATPVNERFNYVQVGRFFGEGDAYDGPGGEYDGIDWLDFRGSTIMKNPDQANPIQGMCFSTMLPDNIPPIATGFPANDIYNIGCSEGMDLTIAFATPEEYQKVSVAIPANINTIPGLMFNQSTSTGGESLSITLKWKPDFATQSGTYNLTFVASDDFSPELATLTKTLTIIVASCGDVPIMCHPIAGGLCKGENPSPFCTPYRSPEHCPMDESFPMYIRTRNEIVQSSPSTIEELGYWFHFLQDKAAAFAFTASSGYHAPKIACCGPLETWDSECASIIDSNNSGNGFVIRAVGSHHSNAAVFVLPSGFGGPELTGPSVSMTKAQVISNLNGLTIRPEKVIVEEFIPGTAAGSLPDEYKIHAFNGKIGAITMILDRGTDCACYAEVDADWNRLDTHGCFVPNIPFGKEHNGVCYHVDLKDGKDHAYPMKGHDLCGLLPPIEPSCLLADMVAAAEAISKLIGVYVRIDMFVSGDNKVYIQEYTFNHNNGLSHCSSKLDPITGCIDSCFMGRLWKDLATNSSNSAFELGGPVTPLPSVFAGWSGGTLASQCAAATLATLPLVRAACG